VQRTNGKRQTASNEWEGRLTLLFGPRQKTISECTFRVRSRPSRLSLMALNAAARAWIFDTICGLQSTCAADVVECGREISRDQTTFVRTTLASIKAYSKSVFPESSCWCRKAAFATLWKSAMWRV